MINSLQALGVYRDNDIRQFKSNINSSCLLPRAEVANSNAYMGQADK